MHILNLMCSFATSCRSAFAGAQCGVDFFLHSMPTKSETSTRGADRACNVGQRSVHAGSPVFYVLRDVQREQG